MATWVGPGEPRSTQVNPGSTCGPAALINQVILWRHGQHEVTAKLRDRHHPHFDVPKILALLGLLNRKHFRSHSLAKPHANPFASLSMRSMTHGHINLRWRTYLQKVTLIMRWSWITADSMLLINDVEVRQPAYQSSVTLSSGCFIQDLKRLPYRLVMRLVKLVRRSI